MPWCWRLFFFWHSIKDHMRPATSGSLNKKVMGSSSSKWWLCASFSIRHSVIKCTSVSSAWPHCWHMAGSGWSWFLVILLRYHASSVVSPVWRCKSRVHCAGVNEFFSWFLFTYVACDIAGVSILPHFWAQWWRITVLAVLKSIGAAVCCNVEASFAILSACMFPSIPQWSGIHWNVIYLLPLAAICSTSESMWCTISSFPVVFASFWMADQVSIQINMSLLGYWRPFLEFSNFL